MEFLKQMIDYILHAQDYLAVFIQDYGPWVYALLFAIIFCETGLVVTPFLPGDSLLFAVGALTAQHLMKIEIVLPLLMAAAILGNVVNYGVGKWIGPRVFHFESNRFFNKAHLVKAQSFYEKYGGRAVILARFIPIVRTFAPFVAGVGSMNYVKFTIYNVAAGILWVGMFVGAGAAFGNLPSVKSNLHIVVLGIIVVSLLPIAWELGKAWLEKRKA